VSAFRQLVSVLWSVSIRLYTISAVATTFDLHYILVLYAVPHILLRLLSR
jgi:hypothetical protein